MERFFAPIPIDLWVQICIGMLVWFVICIISEEIRIARLRIKGILPPDPWDEVFKELPPDSEDEDES